jgi:hypothetical protein
MSPAVIEGDYRYTSRAFGQDSAEALGRDLVRGTIELITNSDDAYARLGIRGKIWIGVEHTRGSETYRLIVRDRAGGMRLAEMRTALTSIGERTSEFEEGAAVRGNRGRGAKDLAGFGETVFESIKDGRYSKVTLRRDGWVAERERDATREDRERLHIPRGGGTQVTVHVERSVRCPRHDRLARDIARDFQLRDIMADPDREVLLAKLNDPAAPAQRLRYEVDWEALPDLLDTEIEVGGYEGRVRVRAWKLPERCDQGASDRTRTCGLLLCGRRAIYDNTLFRFEGLPYAGWVTGRIEAIEIDDLTREFDDVEEREEAHPDSNPIPIISRRRQGLATDHPYTQALTEAVEAVLEPVMDELEEAERERSRELESAETRRELDRLGKEAAKLMQQSLRELEEEEDPAHRPGALPAIALVPNPMRIEVGETRTLSVVCDRAGLEEGDEVSLTVEPSGVVELGSDPVRLGTHRDREDALSAQVRVQALEVDECLIEAAVNGRSEVADVHVVEPEEPEIVVPEALEFERERVKVGLGKRRTIDLRAPSELVAEHGTVVELRSTDAGIVLRRSNTELEHDPELGFDVGKVRIEGRALGARGKIEARLGPEVAELAVNVAERDDGVPDLRIEFSDERPTAFRAYFDPPNPREDGSQTLKILVRHEAIEPVLGEDLSGEHDPGWKVLLAEIVTEAMVRRLMAKRYPVPQRIEAAQLYRDDADWTSRLLPRIQRIVLRGPGLSVARPAAAESAEPVAAA